MVEQPPHRPASPTTPPLADLIEEIADEPVSERDESDSETEREAEDLERQEQAAKVKGLLQDIEERKKYANRIFCLLAIWLIGIFLLLALQGFLSPWKVFYLSDKVLISAIGGTTINVIGIFIVVARYLFPRRDGKIKKKKN